MLKVKSRPLTIHDYRQLPDAGPRYQLIEGEMEMAPAPRRSHQRIALKIAYLLQQYIESHPIGEVNIAPFDVYLTDVNVYQPDVIFVSNANSVILTDLGAEGAPDLVVEILSPKSAHLDTGVKREVYARTGVKELWIIDSTRTQIQVFHLRDNAETPAATYGEQDTFESSLLPGLKVDAAQIFRQ